MSKFNPRHINPSLEDQNEADENVTKIYYSNGKTIQAILVNVFCLRRAWMAEISPFDPLKLTVNPATGLESLGIAYSHDTIPLHRLENVQIYSFFEQNNQLLYHYSVP